MLKSRYSCYGTHLLALLLSVVALSSCAWLQQSSESTTDKVLTTTSTVEAIWSVDVDGRKPADALAYGHVAVTGVGENTRLVIGGRDGRAHIYNASGSELFRIALAGGVDSSATTLASGLVVLGDTSGKLYAIDAQEGKVAWQFSLSSAVTGIPIAIDDDVLVQCADNRIYRIDEHGKKVWSFSSQAGGLGLYLNASPMLHDNKIYALLTTGDAVALEASSGDLVWRKQLLLNMDAAHLADLKAPQAIPVWLPEMTWDGNTVQDAVLFSFYQGDVFLVSAKDGTTLLSHTISFKSAPLMLGDYLYTASSHGVVQAIERSTGIVAWETKLSDGELLGPVLWHNAFWLADSEGVVFRMNKNGSIQARGTFPGSFDRAPVVMNDGVLVHSNLGGLYLVH